MAKGKNANPAEAYRKSQKKKELKKNKAERSKKREMAIIKKDTWDLQDEIAELEGTHKHTPESKTRLEELKSELQFIVKKKEEYLKEHPDQRRFVFRPRRKEGDKPEEDIVLPKKNLFNKKGLPRHPERSIYYDPVMNLYGVAPPGMPYMERPLRPDEVDSDEESDEDEDEITMPDGPPPNGEEPVNSDDEIPMPEGPPPGVATPTPLAAPPAFTPRPPPGLPPTLVPPVAMPQYYPPQPPPTFYPPTTPSPLSSVPRQGNNLGSQPRRPVDFAAATVSAEPELRDLKKEATAFVPTSLKRKRPATTTASHPNAAPALADADDDSEASSNPVRPDLLATLKNQLGAPKDPPKAADDFAKFMDDVGTLL